MDQSLEHKIKDTITVPSTNSTPAQSVLGLNAPQLLSSYPTICPVKCCVLVLTSCRLLRNTDFENIVFTQGKMAKKFFD